MRAYQALPDGYKEIMRIDLQNDRKTAITVNVLAAVVMILFLAAGFLFVSVFEYFDLPFVSFMIRLLVLVIGMIVYIVLHELTHGMVMKACGAQHVSFGFTGLYAFAGSGEDYFDKGSYICTALAPLVLWGVIFGILLLMVPEDWFLVVWFLQGVNIGGAAGDVYVAVRMLNKPASVLVRDTGVDLIVYDRGDSEETAENN